MSNDNDENYIHPMELAVQSILEGPLELLNLNLKSLYESQLILHTILHKMEKTLQETANNLRPGSFPLDEQIISDCSENIGTQSEDLESSSTTEDGVRIDHSDVKPEFDCKDYLQRLVILKKKIKNVEKTLDRVETRIVKIETEIGNNWGE